MADILNSLTQNSVFARLWLNSLNFLSITLNMCGLASFTIALFLFLLCANTFHSLTPILFTTCSHLSTRLPYLLTPFIFSCDDFFRTIPFLILYKWIIHSNRKDLINLTNSSPFNIRSISWLNLFLRTPIQVMHQKCN